MYYNKRNPKPTGIKQNKSYVGITIEERVMRIMNQNEPISDGAQAIYTERKDGVQPEYNIRNDKWDTAIDAMGKVQEMNIKLREERQAKRQGKVIDLPKNEGTSANTSDSTK